MRRLFWMGMGAAAAVSGERWLVRTWRQANRRRIDGPPGPLGRVSSGTVGPSGRVSSGTVGPSGHVSGGTVGPAVDVVGALGVVAGRHAGRIAGFGARRVGDRVRRAVEGGRADAWAREHDLRHAIGLAEPSGQPSGLSGQLSGLSGQQSGLSGQQSGLSGQQSGLSGQRSGRARRAGEQPARRHHRDEL